MRATVYFAFFSIRHIFTSLYNHDRGASRVSFRSEAEKSSFCISLKMQNRSLALAMATLLHFVLRHTLSVVAISKRRPNARHFESNSGEKMQARGAQTALTVENMMTDGHSSVPIFSPRRRNV
jgi:hypothetical protein